MKENLLRTKSRAFAIRIIRLYKLLSKNRHEYVMSDQVLRCGTSIGANISEAIYAESRADLIHKYAIAQKECAETLYWLDLLYNTDYIDEKEFNSINNDCMEILRILGSSIVSLKKQQ